MFAEYIANYIGVFFFIIIISLKVNKLEYAFPYYTGKIFLLYIVCAYKQRKRVYIRVFFL